MQVHERVTDNFLKEQRTRDYLNSPLLDQLCRCVEHSEEHRVIWHSNAPHFDELLNPTTDEAKQRVVVEALEDIKGRDILVYNTARMPSMFERVVIASGDSTRQVRALADHLQDKVREAGAGVYGVEGEAGGEWVLVDLGEIVVHIMHPTVRSFYNLEEIWGGKSVNLKRPVKKISRKKPKPRGKAPRRRARR